MIAALIRLQFLAVVRLKDATRQTPRIVRVMARRRSWASSDCSMRQRADQSATRSQTDAACTRPVRPARHLAQAKAVHVRAGPLTLTRQLSHRSRTGGMGGGRWRAVQPPAALRSAVPQHHRRVPPGHPLANPIELGAAVAPSFPLQLHPHAGQRIGRNGVIGRHSHTDRALVAAVPKPAKWRISPG